jgi:hypothetical protein
MTGGVCEGVASQKLQYHTGNKMVNRNNSADFAKNIAMPCCCMAQDFLRLA